ncbi:MAG: glycosyltransferase family 4 protein [Microgenomates group bacterium]
MKILLVCNYYQPQLAYAESEIARALTNAGHRVEVITGDLYFPFPNFDVTVKRVLKDRYVGTGKRVEKGILVTRNKIFFEIFARSVYFGINDKIKKYKPDIVITFGLSTPANIQVSLSKFFHSFKYIGVDSHLPSELFSTNVLLKKIFYFLFRTLFSPIIATSIDKIIAAQEGTKDVITNYYGLTKNITVISHGTNVDHYKFDKKLRSQIRKKYLLRNSDFVIIYTGKIIESKGIDILTKAFAELASKYNDMYLLLVGSGTADYKEVCMNVIPKKYQNRVIWEEFQPYKVLPAFYSASDLAIWPLQESLSMNDAAACSLPLIVNDTVGVKERLSNDNALLYKKGSHRDLFKKIEYLYSQPKRRLQMGKNGERLVTTTLSWDSVAERYIS